MTAPKARRKLPADEHPHDPALREYFTMLSRRKLTVLVVFLITTVSVAVGAYLTPPLFTASASLIVKYGREFVYRPEVGDAGSPKALDLAEIVNSEVEILRSRDLARQVVEEIGVGRLYPDLLDEPDLTPERVLAIAVGAFQGDLDVTAVFDSSIIRVAFESPDAPVAAQAVNLLVEKFKDKHLEIFSEKKADFLETQLEKHREQLAEAENALQSFRREHGIHEIEGQKNALLEQRVQVESELRQARSRIVELERQLAVLEGGAEDGATLIPDPVFAQQRVALISRRAQLASLLHELDSKVAALTANLERYAVLEEGPETPLPGRPGVERFRSLDEALIRLLDLELREQETLRLYTDRSREVSAVRDEILLVKKFLRQRGAYVGQLLESSVRDELRLLTAQRDALREQMGEIDDDLRSLARDERSLRLQTLRTELEALGATRESLTAELGKLERELASLTDNEKVFRALERRVTVSDRSYQTFLQKYDEAVAMEQLDEQRFVNVRVIEEADVPVSPTGLPRRIKIVLGAAVGLLAGCAAAFFLELLKRSS